MSGMATIIKMYWKGRGESTPLTTNHRCLINSDVTSLIEDFDDRPMRLLTKCLGREITLLNFSCGHCTLFDVANVFATS